MIADHNYETDMKKQMHECVEYLQRVEDLLSDSTFFNGVELALIDQPVHPFSFAWIL